MCDNKNKEIDYVPSWVVLIITLLFFVMLYFSGYLDKLTTLLP